MACYRHLPAIQAVDPPRHKMWRWAEKRWEELVAAEVWRRNPPQKRQNGECRVYSFVCENAVRYNMLMYCIEHVQTTPRYLFPQR